MTLSSVVITDSRAYFGGGVYSVGELSLMGSIIRGNQASNDSDMVTSQGGGIFAEGSLIIVDSTISHNTAESGGGIFAADANLTDSTLSGNTASISGGGVQVTTSLSAINSTVSGNQATNGGGLYTIDGRFMLTSSTVTLNVAKKDSLGMGGLGGGLGFDTEYAGESLTVVNSIIAGNKASLNPDFTAPLEAADLSVSHSLIGDNQGTTLAESQTADAAGNLVGSAAGGGVIVAGLAPLANNGGRTETHALQPTSPAIDAGSMPNGSLMFDQRGAPFLRVFDGDGSGVAQADMGAFELQTIVPGDLVVSTTLDESDGDYSAGDLSLREAISLANASASAQTITFDPILFASPQTIFLSLGDLDITNSMTLTGIRQGVLTIDAQQASRVIDISAAAVDVTISGMTLNAGSVEGDNLTFRDTTYKGGALRALNTGDLTLSDVAVTNSQTNGAFGDGGGIFALHDVFLTNSRVTGNRAYGVRPFGGGIYSYGQVVISRSTISDNVADGDSAKGGGIYARRDVELVATTVSGNSANDNGGGIFAMRDVILDNATISGNSSHASGGGIYSVNGTVAVQSSTIYENSAADQGGGIAFYVNDMGEALVIQNSIVAGNTAGTSGADFIAPFDYENDLDVTYSLIGENEGTTLSESQSGSSDGNLVGAADGGGRIDPLLAELAFNGGTTRTHALLEGSPAIDRGDRSVVSLPNSFDQRGAPFARVAVPDDGTGTPRLDMGAFERQILDESRFIVSTIEDEFDNDFSEGDISLREAINAANGNPGMDVITFSEALFVSSQDLLLTLGELEVADSLSIVGPGRDLLVVDGQQHSRIFHVTSSESELALSGMTLTGGRTVGTLARGGAISSLATGEVTILDSTLTGNSTEGSYGDGGAIYARYLTLTNSIVHGNHTSGDSARGGGLAGDRITVIGSTISGNSTTGTNSHGGGIRAGDAAYIYGSTLSQNETMGTGAEGGGVHSSTVVIVDATFYGNQTAGMEANGGAVWGLSSTRITNSTISGNAAFNASGGGVFTTNGDIEIQSSTLVDNQAYRGGGIGFAPGSSGSLTIANSIVASNGADFGPDFQPPLGSPTVTFSLIGDNAETGLEEAQIPDSNGNYVGSSAVDAGGIIDPMLGPLALNGGSTQTHALLAGSPAIDAGDGDVAFDPTSYDQRGAPLARVFDGNDDRVPRLDMGAYEFQTLTAAFLEVSTLDDKFDGDYSVGNVSLREAIVAANGSAGADTITFDPDLFNTAQTIQLGVSSDEEMPQRLGELTITEALTIVGPGRDLLTIDALGNSRIFQFMVSSGSFAVSNMTLTGGRTAGPGGAIYSASTGRVSITDTTISSNRTTRDAGSGGGVFARGDMTITRSVIRDNITDGAAAAGGGLYSAGSITVSQSTIRDNTTSGALSHGGGVRAESVTISASTVSGNSAEGDGARGGGMHVTTEADVLQSTISGNFANDTGGGLATVQGMITIANTTVFDNLAGRAGGGLDVSSGQSLAIANSIVAGNMAAASPDFVAPSGAANLNVVYSLIGDNAGTSLAESPAADTNGNLVGSATGGGIINPRLSGLANNGGTTRTHALLPGSPAFDAGDPSAVAGMGGIPEFDQRGAPFQRVFGVLDMGSVEAAMADFGDAPNSYPTLLPGGAFHFGGGPKLGAERDVEFNGIPSDNADGDDLTGLDDEDGVGLSLIRAGQANASFTVTVTVAADEAALLDAWIDFDQNGAWEASEQIAASVSLTQGGNLLVFAVPVDAMTGQTFARFRLSSAGGLSPQGPAPDGEIEDYVVTIEEAEPPVPRDFGDAPGTFPTTLANDGANHIATGPLLGALRDAESDGLASEMANGDDDDALDDEDGVIVRTLMPGEMAAEFTVTVSAAPSGALLDAWIDFDGNGAWEASEQILTSLAVSEGENTVTFAVPEDLSDGLRVARFRLSTTGGLQPTGAADDGEVEDYLVSIETDVQPPVTWHNTANPFDTNNDGVVAPLDALLVINEFNERVFSDPITSKLNDNATPPPFFDVNDDGFASPIDALLVINALPSSSGGTVNAASSSSVFVAFATKNMTSSWSHSDLGDSDNSTAKRAASAWERLVEDYWSQL